MYVCVCIIYNCISITRDLVYNSCCLTEAIPRVIGDAFFRHSNLRLGDQVSGFDEAIARFRRVRQVQTIHVRTCAVRLTSVQ